MLLVLLPAGQKLLNQATTSNAISGVQQSQLQSQQLATQSLLQQQQAQQPRLQTQPTVSPRIATNQVRSQVISQVIPSNQAAAVAALPGQGTLPGAVNLLTGLSTTVQRNVVPPTATATTLSMAQTPVSSLWLVPLHA